MNTTKFDNGFKVGDFVEVDNYPYAGVVKGKVTKVEGVYIWLDDDPAPYHTASAYLLNNVITLEDQVKAGLPIAREIGNDVESLLYENKRLRQALAFYADEANNHREITAVDGQVWPSEVAKDGGLRAQQALAGEEPVGYLATAPATDAAEGA